MRGRHLMSVLLNEVQQFTDYFVLQLTRRKGAICGHRGVTSGSGGRGIGGRRSGGRGSGGSCSNKKIHTLSYFCFLVVQKDPIELIRYLYTRIITHIILIFLVRIYNYIHMCVLICGCSGCSSR